MKQTIAFLILSISAQAGVLRVATYPLRHPVKSQEKVFTVATFPVRHPVKAVKTLAYPVRHPVKTVR